MMSAQSKQVYVVQGNYGCHGWEDLEECDSRRYADYLAGEYRFMGHSIRIINRTEDMD